MKLVALSMRSMASRQGQWRDDARILFLRWNKKTANQGCRFFMFTRVSRGRAALWLSGIGLDDFRDFIRLTQQPEFSISIFH